MSAQAVDEGIDGGLAAEGSVVAGHIAIGIGKVDLLRDAGGVDDGVPERPGGGRVERAEAEPGGVGAGAEVAIVAPLLLGGIEIYGVIADVARESLLEIVVANDQVIEGIAADAAGDETLVDGEAGIPLVDNIVGDGEIVDADAAGDFVG